MHDWMSLCGKLLARFLERAFTSVRWTMDEQGFIGSERYRLSMSETISTSVSAAASFSAEDGWGRPAPKRYDMVLDFWANWLGLHLSIVEWFVASVKLVVYLEVSKAQNIGSLYGEL